MPRLLTLLPCERVLFGDRETVSLIVVLSEIHFRIFPNAAPPPPGAVVFYNWTIFCQWQIGLGEETEEWEQRIALESPTGITVFTSISKFKVPTPQIKVHRMIASLDMLPFLPEGEYKLIANWRKVGDDDAAWREGGVYPIRVIYDHLSLPDAGTTT